MGNPWVETYIDNATQQTNNFMAIQSQGDKSAYSIVTFGNDWNYHTGIDAWFSTDEGSDLFNFAELAMVQDLNNNAQLGI